MNTPLNRTNGFTVSPLLQHTKPSSCSESVLFNYLTPYISNSLRMMVFYYCLENSSTDKPHVVTGQPDGFTRPRDPPRPSVAGCGRVNVNGGLHLGIYGGEDVQLGEFPWMALVGWAYAPLRHSEDIVFSCGGTLITDRYVLTAAHCFYDESSDLVPTNIVAKVRLGSVTRWPQGQSKGHLRVYHVDRHTVHEQYNDTTLENDIALLRLSTRVEISDYIRPICLPDKYAPNQPPAGETVINTGWGMDEHDEASESLLRVALTVTSQDECISHQKDKVFVVDDRVLCASGGEGEGSCQGDSGGPLMWRPAAAWTVVGVVSWGDMGRGCGLSDNPVVYTRVDRFLDWIRHIVCGSAQSESTVCTDETSRQ